MFNCSASISSKECNWLNKVEIELLALVDEVDESVGMVEVEESCSMVENREEVRQVYWASEVSKVDFIDCGVEVVAEAEAEADDWTINWG